MIDYLLRILISSDSILFGVLVLAVIGVNKMRRGIVRCLIMCKEPSAKEWLKKFLDKRIFYSELVEQLRMADVNGSRVEFVIVAFNNFRTAFCEHCFGVNDSLISFASAFLLEVAGVNSMIRYMGGGEFVVSVEVPVNDTAAASFASKISLALSRQRQFHYCGNGLRATFGYCDYPKDAVDALTLVSKAFISLQQSFGNSEFKVSGFNAAMPDSSDRHAFLENELKSAIKNNHLILMFQPQISAVSGDVVGAEALLRWTHGALGDVSPEEFISIAERSDLIVELGRWVLRQACLTAAHWNSACARKTLRIAVNVSARQLEHPNFFSDVKEALALSGLPPCLLELELTETCVISSLPTCFGLMARLQEAGVRLALDDFGTGYSSLTYLRALPLNVVKMDKAFIESVPNSGDCIPRAIISMAHGLDLTVIAEGVERCDQLEWLINEGCDIVQGYFTGKPVSSSQFMEIVDTSPNLAVNLFSENRLERVRHFG